MGTTSKALGLLGLFSVDRPEISLGDAARLAGRDKATTHRHLAELESLGFVERNPETRAYRVGPAVLRLATIRETCFPLRAALAPLVDAAAQDLGELVHVSLVQGQGLMPVYHADPHAHGTAVHFDPGALMPAHGTASGLAVLAFGPAALREAVLAGPLERFTDTTPQSRDDLAARIAATRARGHAHSRGAYDREVESIALPLFDGGATACGAVAVALPASRATDAAMDRALARLNALAPALGAALGGRFPAEPATARKA